MEPMWSESSGGSSSGSPWAPQCRSSVRHVVEAYNCSGEDCSQFCSDFEKIPVVYSAFSAASFVSCLLVFATYALLPRLRHGGYSSRVFIYRTILDFLIASGHILSHVTELTEVHTHRYAHYGCMVLGAFNVFNLMASNVWYLVLAVDLGKAIQNPFSAAPTYGVLAQTCVWGLAGLSVAVLTVFTLRGDGTGLGLSMFYWCWISIDTNITAFALLSLFTYFLPHFIIWVFSTVVLIFAVAIFFGGRFAASSETRKFVMKQNLVYVLVLGIETGVIVPLWLTELGLLSRHDCQENYGRLYFYTTANFALAVVFAMVHSSRGTVDLFVWWLTFSIGPKDFKFVFNRIKLFRRSPCNTFVYTMHTPLIKADTAVNRALRRDAIYCINIAILDAVVLNVQQRHREETVGSVREPFVAHAMMQWAGENRQQEAEEKYTSNPYFREQTERKITFPPSASIQKFAFQDIEPTVFHLLRDAYSISPAEYRQSFKLKNAADVESSGMLEKFTEGKSGSFFYFSHDFHYIIKTVTSEEERFLRKIAYCYYRHMKKNPNSLIVRFFGLHKVKLAPEQRYISVVVMENVFYNHHRLKIHRTYDLKGSTVGRRALKGGKTAQTHRGTLKDLDLTESVYIGPDVKTQLMEQLQQDVQFLTRNHIMDYSLLLGVHNHSYDNNLTGFVSGSVEGSDMEESIVDVNWRNGCPPTPSVLTPLAADSFSFKQPEPHAQWFRRDLGGLRSYSPFHPCTAREQEVDGPTSTAITEYQGIKARDLPVCTYYFGVVDILQEYNVRKRAEHLWKTRFLCQNKRELSAVNPKEYGERFLRAMDGVFQ